MLNNQMLELIATTSEILDLEDTVVEKDYYVTQVIHALSGTENDYFRIVFAGGTCLSKGHKIIKRMSEDVDFKIQYKQRPESLSKNQFLKELKQFRSLIISRLTLPNIDIGEPVVRNEGQYLRIELIYPSAFQANRNLRPHILLEFTLSEVRLPIENLSIRTMIEDTLENEVVFVPSETQCVSVVETAIEKWVGLTRRIIAIEREYHHDDPMLVRHIYDLNSIQSAKRLDKEFFVLAKDVVKNDARQFKNQHPEYSVNPGAEIGCSLVLLKDKPIWKARYQEFIEAMVYDNSQTEDYDSALLSLENISKEIIITLS